MHHQTAAPVAVLGAGSWGTALALLLARNGHSTLLWGHDAAHVEAMARGRENARYLPGAAFPAQLAVDADLSGVLDRARELLIAVPSRAFRATVREVARGGCARVAWATKGLEPETDKLLHEVAREELGEGRECAVISGPTFAREVALGLPTAVTVAATSNTYGAALAELLHGPTFRAYCCADLIGVEVAGALKNVLAIAAGIADGLKLGANTRAALVTRGLAEMMRLGEAMGGRRETFVGLAGLGDLVLTCTDDQSRNRRLGLALAHGASLAAALREVKQVAEGVHTARAAWALARSRGIDMPITEQVHAVLYEGRSPREATEALLRRDPRPETL